MTRPVMLTLFSDASWCPNTGAAGWGAWARKDGWDKGRFMGGPMRRTDIETPNSAEICGIASALHQLDGEGLLADVEVINLQCDNTVALGILLFYPQCRPAKVKASNDVAVLTRPAWKKVKPIERVAAGVINDLTKDMPVWLRHIRGHQTDLQGRSWVNDQCDAEAKRHMNARRRELEASLATG